MKRNLWSRYWRWVGQGPMVWQLGKDQQAGSFLDTMPRDHVEAMGWLVVVTLAVVVAFALFGWFGASLWLLVTLGVLLVWWVRASASDGPTRPACPPPLPPPLTPSE